MLASSASHALNLADDEAALFDDADPSVDAVAAAKERGQERAMRARAAATWALSDLFVRGTGIFPAGPWLKRSDYTELGRAYVQAAGKAAIT
jgi:hypothetical protein